MFVMINELLTDEERREMADLSLAGITYNERLRDFFAGFFDKRIARLREEHVLWSSEQDTPPASAHAATDSEDTQSYPSSTDIAPSEPDDNVPNPDETEPSCGNARVEHIVSCKGQREATLVIGELNPDGFAVREAAALIRAAGLSKGRVDTVMSNLHHYMTNDDSWQKIGPSKFRLLPKIRAVDGGNPEQLHQKNAEEIGCENGLVQVA